MTAPRLVVTAGPCRGESFTLEGTAVSIGRDPSCTLCLPDATLSRRHAALPVTGLHIHQSIYRVVHAGPGLIIHPLVRRCHAMGGGLESLPTG